MKFLFLGLTGSKTVDRVQQALSLCGAVNVMRLVPLGFDRSRHRNEVAQLASERAIRLPSTEWGRSVRKWLYGAQYSGARAMFERDPELVAVCWNGLNGTRHAFMAAARDAGARTLFFELAPLPGRITIDPSGVNGHACLPRTIEPYIRWMSRSAVPPSRWRELGSTLRQRPSILGAKPSSRMLPSLDDPFVFVPLQVPNDSQLRIFGAAFRSVEAYVAALIEVANSLPQGWHIRIKDHPTSRTSVLSESSGLVGHPRVFVDNITDTFEQVARARSIFTVNSSVGLQAFFYDKPVVVSGEAFWAINGIAHVARTRETLAAALSEPSAIAFDQGCRDAFMNFISERYYPILPDFNIKAEHDVKIWRQEVRARLEPGWPNL